MDPPILTHDAGLALSFGVVDHGVASSFRHQGRPGSGRARAWVAWARLMGGRLLNTYESGVAVC